MADNTPITPGTGVDIATEEIAGVHHQKIKVEFGATDVATMVEQTAPLPVRFGSPTAANLSSAAINEATSGDRTILAGTGGQTVRLYKAFVQNTGASDVSVKYRDGTSTDFHPALLLKPGGSYFLDFDGEPWFVTSSGNGLVLNLSASIQVSGRFYYTKS
jgi:hypothetical protein